MHLRLFNHANPSIFEGSFSPADECIGSLLTDPDERRLGRTNYELVATFHSRCLGNPELDLPDQVPFIYNVRNPDFRPLAYKVRFDGRIKIQSQFRTLTLPASDLCSSETIFGLRQPYNPKDASDALEWAGVFGLDDLNELERERAISIVTESWGDDWSSRCIVPFELYESKWSILEGEWIRPFWQNASFSCPADETDCGYDSTIPIATLETDDDIDLFGYDGPLLILTFCKTCKAFGVENQAD